MALLLTTRRMWSKLQSCVILPRVSSRGVVVAWKEKKMLNIKLHFVDWKSAIMQAHLPLNHEPVKGDTWGRYHWSLQYLLLLVRHWSTKLCHPRATKAFFLWGWSLPCRSSVCEVVRVNSNCNCSVLFGLCNGHRVTLLVFIWNNSKNILEFYNVFSKQGSFDTFLYFVLQELEFTEQLFPFLDADLTLTKQPPHQK